MKYLFFKKVPFNYGCEYQRFQNGVKERGIGAYENKDAKILLKMFPEKIDEIKEEEYDELKKKLNIQPTSFRAFKTQHQDATKDPNAVYAETESKGSEKTSSKAEDLVDVGDAEVEDPLKDTE